MYYKSAPLFRERLSDASAARWLPWLPAQREVRLAFGSGRQLRMAAGQWPDLPAACRLERAGFDFEFLADRKRVRCDGVVLDSPLWARDEEEYYREVFRDDVYGIRGRDLSGRTVVDIGAFVGDTAIAFARAGALVHAFEPSAGLCSFLRHNIEHNGLAGRVVVHAVGLGVTNRQIERRGDALNFVDGVPYVLAHLPPHVDILKIDCEGGEYHLLGDPRFLAHLAPREIRLEYHHGPDDMVAALGRSGYAAQVAPRDAQFGLIQAMRA
jgi:hypothetical protein